MTANGNHVMMGFLNHFILHVDTHKADLAGANSLGPLMGRSRSEDKRSGTSTLKHNDSASLAECVCVSFVRLYEIHHHQYAKQDKDNENPMIFNFSNYYLKTFEKNNFFWVALINKKNNSFIFLQQRLSRKDPHNATGNFDPDVSREDHQTNAYYDDDQQLIYQDGRRSPRRWFLPSPQG